MGMKINHEDGIMIAINDWILLKRYDSFIFHLAQERKCTPQYGAKLKRMGVRAGVADLFITRPCKGFHGYWIEVKAGKNKPAQAQLDFLDNRRAEGYKAEWLVGFDETVRSIESYIG